MAFTIRIIGVPVQDKHSIWIVDNVNWWPMEDFINITGEETKDSRFRQSVNRTLYLDYVGIFNREEFVKLNDGYKARFLAKSNPGSWYEEQQKRIGYVDEYLRQRQDTKWILVERYEWETGMN
jgi:hypothetical protein